MKLSLYHRHFTGKVFISTPEFHTAKMARALACLIATTLLIGLLLANAYGSGNQTSSYAATSSDELQRLRYANSVLLQKVSAFEKEAGLHKKSPRCVLDAAALRAAQERAVPKPCEQVEAASRSSCHCNNSSGGSSGSSGSSSSSSSSASAGASPASDPNAILASSLLAAHSKWDWRAIALEVLQPFEHIEQQQLDAAVESCNDNGTMYCQRMQVSTSLMASLMAFLIASWIASRIASLIASLMTSLSALDCGRSTTAH